MNLKIRSLYEGVYKNSKNQILKNCITEENKGLSMLGESFRIAYYLMDKQFYYCIQCTMQLQ